MLSLAGPPNEVGTCKLMEIEAREVDISFGAPLVPVGINTAMKTTKESAAGHHVGAVSMIRHLPELGLQEFHQLIGRRRTRLHGHELVDSNCSVVGVMFFTQGDNRDPGDTLPSNRLTMNSLESDSKHLRNKSGGLGRAV